MAKTKKEHKTDNPLKRLFMSETDNMTTWLLDGAVKNIQQRNIELPANTLRSDQVFEITLANGKEIILHCEFEGGDDTNVMSWRMQY